MARLALNLVVRKELARYIRSFVLLYTRENSHSDAHHRRHLVQQNNFSPSNKCCVPNEAVAVDNEPVEVQSDADDAAFGLSRCTTSRRSGTHATHVPYLSSEQRLVMQIPSTGSDWDQLSNRD
jgi:hypothetical protein